MLRNGTMFPDGGYAVGDLQELAHWEQFQDAYRVYIEDTYDTPFTDEGAMHVAFLMVSPPCMADQVFDSFYGAVQTIRHVGRRTHGQSRWRERCVWYMPPHRKPHPRWFPEELFEDLSTSTPMRSAQTMARGQPGAAIHRVTSASQDPEQIGDYRNTSLGLATFAR